MDTILETKSKRQKTNTFTCTRTNDKHRTSITKSNLSLAKLTQVVTFNKLYK